MSLTTVEQYWKNLLLLSLNNVAKITESRPPAYVNLTSTPPGKQNERRSLYFIGSCLSGGYTNKTCHASKFSIIRPHNQSIQVC